VISVKNEYPDETSPNDHVAPARADSDHCAVPLVFYNFAGPSKDDYPHGCEEEEQNEEDSMKVVVSRSGVGEKARIERDDP
jgi:hypothetical protein